MKINFGFRAVLICVLSFASLRATAQDPDRYMNGEWRHFAGDKGSAKYSALDQINASNVESLELAWAWNADEAESQTGQPSRPLRVTPLMVDGRLYIITTLGVVAAIEPSTGKTQWTYDPKVYEAPMPTHGGFGHRGLEYWADGDDKRLIIVNGAFQLIALNAETGMPIPGFGEDGIVDLKKNFHPRVTNRNYNVKGPATVCRDTIVFGSVINDLTSLKTMPPGNIQAYDVRTGKLKWTFNTVPQGDEFGVETWEDDSWKYTGNTNVWSWISADEELGHFYLPMGTPTNDWYGGHRNGDNLFGESIVCLDAETGKRVWHYQTVHHGIWDYDLPTAPIPVDITVDGKAVKALAAISKNAFTYVLNRETGEPVWPIEEKPVPASDVPGEKTSPTQPFPSKPPPFDLQGLTHDDMIDFTPQLRAEAINVADEYVYGPLYTPPSIVGQDGKKGTISVPGINGGACTFAGAFDPETGLLYVQSMTLPWILGLKPPDPAMSDMKYVFESWVKYAPRVQGLPITKPPYARITAIDLNQGEIVWQEPFGEGPRARVNEIIGDGTDVGRLGSISPAAAYLNGPLLTKSLLFGMVTHTGEEEAFGLHKGGMLYAYDKSTGDVVFELALHNIFPSSLPMTYMHEGKQYLLFTAMDAQPDTKAAFQLRAYALAESE
jgi:quinoprotein glucose dehydrogenase